MKTFKSKEKLIAIWYQEADWIKGLNFFTPPELNIQVSSWIYDKGQIVASHIHKANTRHVERTHEVTYMKEGKMRVLLYDEDKQFLEDFMTIKGDIVVYVNGGHGYEILADNTQVIEVKNGPFSDVNTDKEKIE